MTGILEQINGKLDQVLAILAQSSAQGNVSAQQGIGLPATGGAPVGVGMPLPGGQPAQTLAFPSSQPQVQPAQYPAVSAEQITALITPHVADPNLKAALQGQMAAMGIGALPDAQPHQYGELYARFQAVIAQFAAAPQPTAAPSII